MTIHQLSLLNIKWYTDVILLNMHEKILPLDVHTHQLKTVLWNAETGWYEPAGKNGTCLLVSNQEDLPTSIQFGNSAYMCLQS